MCILKWKSYSLQHQKHHTHCDGIMMLRYVKVWSFSKKVFIHSHCFRELFSKTLYRCSWISFVIIWQPSVSVFIFINQVSIHWLIDIFWNETGLFFCRLPTFPVWHMKSGLCKDLFGIRPKDCVDMHGLGYWSRTAPWLMQCTHWF